ncbi:hypothetical protein BC835DRAFT_1266883, partial [Cytidiella melzeri]
MNKDPHAEQHNGHEATQNHCLCIWQQNVNKLLEAQLDLLNAISPNDIDMILLEEPYINSQGFSRGSSHWAMIYPPDHRNPTSSFRRTRSITLISTRINSNIWQPLEVPSRAITGVS